MYLNLSINNYSAFQIFKKYSKSNIGNKYKMVYRGVMVDKNDEVMWNCKAQSILGLFMLTWVQVTFSSCDPWISRFYSFQLKVHKRIFVDILNEWARGLTAKTFFHSSFCSCLSSRRSCSKGPDTPNRHQRTSCNESDASGPKSFAWTHHEDYSKQPTSMHVLLLCGRK